MGREGQGVLGWGGMMHLSAFALRLIAMAAAELPVASAAGLFPHLCASFLMQLADDIDGDWPGLARESLWGVAYEAQRAAVLP